MILQVKSKNKILIFRNIVYHKKGGKNKKEESDDEFEVKECDKKSESEDESLSSSGSDLVEESEIESNKPKKKKKAIKPKIHVYDNQTIASNAASSSSLIPSGVNQSAKKQNKNPFSLIDEDVEEIDGQKIPDFARKEFIRDKNLRRPDDPDYDPSTIDIPDKLYEQLTPGMKQYWNIK